jgi:hypothetical protein
MASADSCPALTVQVSPSKVFKLSTRFVRLYLLLLSLTLGFRVCLHTPRQQAASLPVRVPTTVSFAYRFFRRFDLAANRLAFHYGCSHCLRSIPFI